MGSRKLITKPYLNLSGQWSLLKIVSLLFLILCQPVRSQTSLLESFVQPDNNRPWICYNWGRESVSISQIREDMITLKNMGFGGIVLQSACRQARTKNSLRNDVFSIADSLGLKLGLSFSDGMDRSDKEKIQLRETAQKLVCSDTIVVGGKLSDIQISRPYIVSDSYKDLAIFAFPSDDSSLVSVKPGHQKRKKGDVSEDGYIPLDKLLCLTATLNGNTLHYKLPKGRWKILRVGVTAVDLQNNHSLCDLLSVPSTQEKWNNWKDNVFGNADTALINRVVDCVYLDNEAGVTQNWPDKFDSVFKLHRGYDLISYLPVLVNYPIENKRVTEKILQDSRLTMDELSAEIVSEMINVLRKKYTGKISVGGSKFNQPEIINFEKNELPTVMVKNEEPSQVYWNKVKDAVAMGHVLGRSVIQTELRVDSATDWAFAESKTRIDSLFIAGGNRILFPASFFLKLIEVRNSCPSYLQKETAFKMWSKTFTDYIARCQVMLQYGHALPDLLVLSSNYQDPDLPTGYIYDFIQPKSFDDLFVANNQLSTIVDSLNYRAIVFPVEASSFFATEEKKQNRSHVEYLNFNELNERHLLQDPVISEKMLYTHRRGDMGDVYFISNQENKRKSTGVVFRNTNCTPSLWNPVSGEISTPNGYIKTDSTTQITLSLEPYQSVFVVFAYKNFASSRNALLIEDTIRLPNKWDVHFSGISRSILQTSLNKSSNNELVDELSGTITYKTLFNFKYDLHKQIDEYTRPVCLSLGDVAGFATVRLNGVIAGHLWTYPYEIDITQLLKKGTNVLEVEIADFSTCKASNDARIGRKKTTLLGPVNILQR